MAPCIFAAFPSSSSNIVPTQRTLSGGIVFYKPTVGSTGEGNTSVQLEHAACYSGSRTISRRYFDCKGTQLLATSNPPGHCLPALGTLASLDPSPVSAWQRPWQMATGLPMVHDSTATALDPKWVLTNGFLSTFACCTHDCPLVQAIGVRLLEPVQRG